MFIVAVANELALRSYPAFESILLSLKRDMWADCMVDGGNDSTMV